MPEPGPPRLLVVLARPDDEPAGMESTLADDWERGVRTSPVMATRGERAWNSPPSDVPGPQAMARLGEVEISAAAAIPGIDEISCLDNSMANSVAPIFLRRSPGASRMCVSSERRWWSLARRTAPMANRITSRSRS